MFRPNRDISAATEDTSALPMDRPRTLAEGCFGKVYKEKYGDKWAAIKRVPYGRIIKKDLDRECEVYKKAEHPNIVKLLGPVTMKNGKYEIPLEFIFGEDLETTIFSVARSKIRSSPAAKSTIILGMCEGLLHLHRQNIIHQDLKPDNIMVEHETNRAVIIDLGLAKFFKRGLNSAADMGNEAYAAPEVLQRGSQRDQRSDVWAMGKIIAELCARVRLATTSVNPDKIKDTLKDNPYCHAVCRMVQPDPSLRATMGGVISAIRVAGAEKSKLDGTGGARHLMPPPNPANARNRSPSPMNRDRLPNNRAHPPLNPKPEVKPANPSPSPPRPDPKRPTQQLQIPPRIKDSLAVVPKSGTVQTSSDLMEKALYNEVKKDLPADLPATGKVVIKKFEDGIWQQKEVVMQDGKIVKYKDVKMNCN